MSELRRALLVAAALGLLAGLGEGAGLLAAQASGRSRWPILLTTGPEVLWMAPLVDGVAFAAVGALAALLAAGLRRRLALALLVGLCTAALGYDWARVTGEIARRHALALAALLGVVAWLAARRRDERVVSAARAAAIPLAALAVLLCAGVEGGARWREARAEKRLPPPPPDARDVIVLVLDTVRSDHLSAYGYARRTTPELERIAAEGVRFDACFSTSAWTLPAHASMLTGRLTWEHGAALEPLDATFPVLGEELAERGFRTGAFSGNLCFFVRRYGFGRGFLRFDDFGWSWRSRAGGTLAGRELLDLAGDRVREPFLRKPARAVTDAFLRWLDAAPERPVFAFLNWFDAHDPYRPPAGVAGRFDGDGVAPAPMPPAEPGESRPWSDEQLAREARAYDECILGLDVELGRLRRELERRGRFERAILIVVGDHGESFGERGARLHRGSLHREQVQVPLIVRAPGLAPAGAVAAGVTSVASLPATVAGLLGIEEAPFPGPSLAEAWREEGGSEGIALLELARHPWPEYRRRPCFDGALRGLVRGRWHYVWHEKRGAQLFDRIADPREERDVLADHPEIAAALERDLHSALAARPRHPRDPTGHDLAHRPDLAGLGYISDH